MRTGMLSVGALWMIVALVPVSALASAQAPDESNQLQKPEEPLKCVLPDPDSKDVCAQDITLPTAESVAKDGKAVTSPPTIVPITLSKREENTKGSCADDGCATLLSLRILPTSDKPDAAAMPLVSPSQSPSGIANQTSNDSNTNGDVTGARMRVTVRRSATQAVVGSDAPTRAIQLVIGLGPKEPEGFAGEVEIGREDFGREPVRVEMSVRRVALQDVDGGKPGWFIPGLGAAGQTERRWITQGQYSDLQMLGACTSAREAKCSVSAGTYTLVSNALGRLPAREFTTHDRANTSEPIVLFIGLGGDTAVVLLECRNRTDMDQTPDQHTCARKAEPWSTSFQRAPYFWAAYLEDVDMPFRTSIDVEFRSHSEPADYEEFDPASLGGRSVEQAKPNPNRLVPIRIGFRRFRVRDAPTYTKVGFSREGQGYGLRQWVRTYSQYGKRRWGFAGGAFVTAIPATRHDISLRDTYLDGAMVPFGREVIQDEKNRIVSCYLAFRWYQWRDRAAEMSQVQRLARYASLPDVVIGAGVPDKFPQNLMIGLSWPLPIVSDRISFVLGASWIQEGIYRNGYTAGARVPLALNEDAIRYRRRTAGVALGLAFDLLQWR